MPIPTTAPPSGLTIHPLSDGRWEATCGRCLSRSIPVGAADATVAWTDLQRIGWMHYVSQYGGSGYAMCPTCAKAGPPEVPRRGTRKRR
jgi:hypothetical protein